MRVSVQLVNISDGYHLWSETYDRTLEDIFAVQDDIAQSVVKELRTTLLGLEPDENASGQAKQDVARAARGRGAHPEAHRLYLLARHRIDSKSQKDIAKAVEYLKESLELDPEFALGWATLGGAYQEEVFFAWRAIAEGVPLAREAVERALSLEPDLAEGHARLATIQMTHDRDWSGAAASYARALELAPGNADVISGASRLDYDLGRSDEAVALCRRAMELDPLSSTTCNRLGMALHRAGRFEEAEVAFRNALELAPDRGGTHGFLAFTLLAQGRGEEALQEAMAESALGIRLWVAAVVHYSQGRRAESDETLRELVTSYGPEAGTQIAEVHGFRGEVDAAFEWLQRAFEHEDPGLSEIKSSPLLRSLHGDLRWGAFLEKMGFGGT
jgi:tetratricopeptide (TPR) repeat protein